MGLIRRMWTRAREWIVRPSSRIGAGILVLAGLAVGVGSVAGFNAFVAHTDTLEFCTSCHAMKEYAFAEYSTTHHYSNRTGIRAVCSDCHVPDAFVPKMIAKTRATFNEIPRHLLRTIHAEEDYEARREVLAHRVWDRMRASDSRECRSCHEWDRMAMDAQRTAARREHEAGRAEGKACIDCHYGIAHRLPASMLEPDDDDEFDWDFGGE